MNIEFYILIVFLVVLLSEFLNVQSVIKRLFRIPQTKFIQPLDCLPCFSWWISLISWNITVMMSVFVTFYLIDKLIYSNGK
jgi:hypothetical protein